MSETPAEIVVLIKTARLPENYEVAKRAIAECERFDECAEWADKAAAIASYARQADNWELEAYAQRIRLRAVRRLGELLKEFDARGGDRRNKNVVALASDRPSRAVAAQEAGVSEHKTRTAVKIAAMPPDEFEAAVESNDPPGTTKLARWIDQKQSEVVVESGYPKGTAKLERWLNQSHRTDHVNSDRRSFEERYEEALRRMAAAQAAEALLRFERSMERCGVETIVQVLREQRGSQKLERVRRALGLVFRLNSALEEAGIRGNPMLRSVDEKAAS
jgi:hypothetical protein